MIVFVYGTLTDRERVDQLLNDYEYAGAATLEGLHRVEGEYPTLAPGGSVDGRLLRTAEIDTLDAYEGVDRGLYARFSIPLEASSERADTAAVYVGDPAPLGATAEWPEPVPFPDCVEQYLATEHVSIRIN